jgi:hypothetical protein
VFPRRAGAVSFVSPLCCFLYSMHGIPAPCVISLPLHASHSRLIFSLSPAPAGTSGRRLRYYAFAAASLLHHLHIFAGVLLRFFWAISGGMRGLRSLLGIFLFLACWVPHLSGSRTHTIA